MSDWPLWREGVPIRVVEGLKPMVAQWEKKTTPIQQRLHAYLDETFTRIGSITSFQSERLFLKLEVDVEQPARLDHHYDLENYLTPLFGRQWIDPSLFVLVSATKCVGGGSRLVVGKAESSGPFANHPGWGHFSYATTRSVFSKEWKKEVQTALSAQVLTPLPLGPVEVVLAWRCSPNCNWVSLWKPTGDIMGPVLGLARPGSTFNPNDDRVITLRRHRLLDRSLRNAVHIGMWWKLAKDIPSSRF